MLALAALVFCACAHERVIEKNTTNYVPSPAPAPNVVIQQPAPVVVPPASTSTSSEVSRSMTNEYNAPAEESSSSYNSESSTFRTDVPAANTRTYEKRTYQQNYNY